MAKARLRARAGNLETKNCGWSTLPLRASSSLAKSWSVRRPRSSSESPPPQQIHLESCLSFLGLRSRRLPFPLDGPAMNSQSAREGLNGRKEPLLKATNQKARCSLYPARFGAETLLTKDAV